MSPRPSLEAETLSFVRAPRGRVHVEQPHDVSDHEPLADAQARAEAWAEFILSGGPKAATLCGRVLVLGDEVGPKKAHRTGRFPDEDLCANCLRVMGEESYLAFGYGGGRGA